MATVEEKYHLDMSDVRQMERMFGAKSPDLLEPLRKLDIDADTLRAQIDEYTTIANELDVLHAELSVVRQQPEWEGEAADSASGFWDVVLTILKWIAAIILFIVGILLLLLGAIIVAIGAICEVIGKVLGWVAMIVMLIVVIVAGVATRNVGATWRAIQTTFGVTILGNSGLVETLGNLFSIVFDHVGKAIVWLAYYLIETGSKLTGDPEFADKLRHERDRLFE